MSTINYQRRPVCYIGGPFRGANDWQRHLNINRAEALAFQVWSAGGVALCPHNNTRHFDGSLLDGIWLEGDLELLRRCDALVLTQDWKTSKGATIERDAAIQWGMVIFEEIANTHMGLSPVFAEWVTAWMARHQ